jgi:hypothetical protein
VPRRKSRNAHRVAVLRGAGWLAVAAAVAQAGTNPGPGGPTLGLILAGALAVALRKN